MNNSAPCATCSTACWFKWKPMHYWWGGKCTLTRRSWGAWPLFSAGGTEEETVIRSKSQRKLDLRIPDCDMFSPRSPLRFTQQLGYGFFSVSLIVVSHYSILSQLTQQKEPSLQKYMEYIYIFLTGTQAAHVSFWCFLCIYFKMKNLTGELS